MLDASATSPEVERSGIRTALLPIGATEQHGRVLPLATDTLEAEAVARALARRLGDAYLLPALPFSCSNMHAGFRGTVWLEAETLDRVVKDIVRSLFGQDFRRVVLVNHHGGNMILRATIRDLNHERQGAKVVLVQPRLVALGELAQILETTGEVHAGEFEASLILAIAPDLVRAPTAGDDFLPPAGPEQLDYQRLGEISPSGVWGCPSYATREKGERAIAIMAERIAAHVEATFASLGLAAS